MDTRFKVLTFLLILFCLPAVSARAEYVDYTGWWWDPVQSGTGYSLEVQCNKAYLVWYLYEESGLNTWYSAVLDVDGKTMTGDLWRYAGWPLEPGYDDSQATAEENLGAVTLNFVSQNTGTITYDPAGSGNNILKNLQRRLIGAADARNLNGWWWDSQQPGIGWFLEAKDDDAHGDVLSAGWFNFRAQTGSASGLPRFFVTWAGFAPADTLYDAPLLDYMGGQTLTGPYVEPTYAGTPGNLELNIPADFNGEATGAALDFSLAGNSYHLTRFAVPGSTCPPGGPGCAPELVNFSPTSSSILWNDVRARFKTPCGVKIDMSSAATTFDGAAIPYDSLVVTNPDSDPSQVEIKYTVFCEDPSEHAVSVSVAGIYGSVATHAWTFTVTSVVPDDY